MQRQRQGLGPESGTQVPNPEPQSPRPDRRGADFALLEQSGARPLQPSSQKGRVWAAIYQADGDETEIGMYDPERFAFSPVLAVPGLEFSSYEMWVDEEGREVYIAYHGQLLQADLAPPDSRLRNPSSSRLFP